MKHKFEMHKIIMIGIFVNAIVIELYSMIVMFVFQDLSALYSLIGAVIGVSISYAIYCAKSFYGRREEERNKLEREKLELDIDNEEVEQPEEEKNIDPELPF